MSLDGDIARFEVGSIQRNRAVSIYEVHLESWMRVVEEQNRPLTCAEIAPKLADHVRRLNFTHVGILSTAPPLPADLTKLVHHLSQKDLGVTLVAPWSSHTENHWDRDWATQMLDFFSQDHPGQFAARLRGGRTGDLILPLSHELVTPDKASLWARMPGDDWRKFAKLRLLFALMFALPGGKLLFMGGEFGQRNAWNPQTSLDWHLVEPGNGHAKMQNWVAELNRVYRTEPALHETDKETLEWVDNSDATGGSLSLLRRGGGDTLLVVFNFNPLPRYNYQVGAPAAGFWKELLNSDAIEHGGSGQGNLGGVEAAPLGWQGKSHSLMVTLPPLGAVFFKQAR